MPQLLPDQTFYPPLVAVVVFEKLGVGLLRKAWFNLDLIWAATLIITGVLTLVV